MIAPESPDELMGQRWLELQQWIFPPRFFRENLKLGEGGEEGRDFEGVDGASLALDPIRSEPTERVTHLT